MLVQNSFDKNMNFRTILETSNFLYISEWMLRKRHRVRARGGNSEEVGANNGRGMQQGEEGGMPSISRLRRHMSSALEVR